MPAVTFRSLLSLLAVVLILATGCDTSQSGSAGSGPAASPAPGGQRPKSIPGGIATIAVIRLDDPALGQEPIDKDIDAGLQQAGIAPTAFKLESYSAAGDLKAVPGLIAKAVEAKSDVILTLLAETAQLAAGKVGNIQHVFTLFGEPSLLGLGKNDAEHADNLTGVYSPVQNALTVPIARGCQPKAKVLGVLFNADLPTSVAHKEALLHTNWDTVKPATAAYHNESDLPKAIAALKAENAEGVILTAGLGSLSKAAVEAAKAAKLPAYGYLVEHAKQGAIVARPLNLRWNGFEAGRRAGRVLLGEPIKQIHFGRGDNFHTYVNLTAAKDLKVTILPPLMRDARPVDEKK